MKIGLLLGLLNEKMNQSADLNKEKEENEIIQGDGKMLMSMM